MFQNISLELPQWAKGTNVYEVNIRQYTPEGNFNAFAKHLPRLKNMGVETLWLMPITPISVKGRLQDLGSYYACKSYVEINPEFGNLNDFKQLVKKAQQLNMKVIIDWVANHTGLDHDWVENHPHWYHQDQQGNFVEKNGWTDVIDLNFDNKNMQLAMIQAMMYWVVECGIDGFRCDMAHLVPLEFWLKARTALEKIKPLLWMAECEEPAYHEVFNISYAWWWMHETEKYAKKQQPLNNIFQVLHNYLNYPFQGLKLFFTSNHDENSWNGTEYEKYGNHADLWMVFSILFKGVPLIYSGQEIPNSKRLKFFTKDQIEWEQTPQKAEFIKTLLKFRSQSQAIKYGDIDFYYLENEPNTLCFYRSFQQEIVWVFLHFSETTSSFHISHELLLGNFKNLNTGLSFNFKANELFEFEPNSYRIYFQNK